METSIVIPDFVDARIGPRGSLENLSQAEIEKLLDSRAGGLYPLFRKCALAVLNSGSETDNAKEIFDRYKDFEVELVRQAWGIKLEIKNAPGQAFVDGEMIRGMKEHVFAVLRDVIFISNEIIESGRFDLNNPAAITNAVFHILRNARILDYKSKPNLVVCWGGHSISTEEYQYTKKVGYELGLRGLDVCTGCGPGAMKGPMKGATIGHAKQRIVGGRYIGLTEPGIIAAEPPNPIVNQLVIMPDIEKRLEAFVRLAHGVVVFPGGVGTAEEILYLLGILLEPANAGQPLKVVLTGPKIHGRLFHPDPALHRRNPREKGRRPAARDRRRPGRSGALHGGDHGAGARFPPQQQRFVQLQLAAQDPAAVPASLRGDARIHARAAPVSRPAGARAGGGSAARVLRHRHRQREGKRRARDREARPVRAHRRRVGDETARRTADGVRCAEANEASGQRLPALLPARRVTPHVANKQ